MSLYSVAEICRECVFVERCGECNHIIGCKVGAEEERDHCTGECPKREEQGDA